MKISDLTYKLGAHLQEQTRTKRKFLAPIAEVEISLFDDDGDTAQFKFKAEEKQLREVAASLLMAADRMANMVAPLTRPPRLNVSTLRVIAGDIRELEADLDAAPDYETEKKKGQIAEKLRTLSENGFEMADFFPPIEDESIQVTTWENEDGFKLTLAGTIAETEQNAREHLGEDSEILEPTTHQMGKREYEALPEFES